MSLFGNLLGSANYANAQGQQQAASNAYNQQMAMYQNAYMNNRAAQKQPDLSVICKLLETL